MPETRITPPFGDQTFDSHRQWVNHASSWLTSHNDFNNTEFGEAKGWRGHHFTAMCFDSIGRRCTNGGEFRRAEEEGTFPIWWIWPDQIPELVGRVNELRAELFQAGQLCDHYATGGAA